MSLLICKTAQGILHISMEHARKSPILFNLIGNPGKIISLPVSLNGLYFVNAYWEGKFDVYTLERTDLEEVIQTAEFLELPELLALCRELY